MLDSAFACLLQASGMTMGVFGQDMERTILVDGAEREYILHVPAGYPFASKPVALVLVLHGGGSEAKHMIGFTGFDDISDREKFFVVYPNGQNKQWRDGRIGEDLPKKYDDVKFISDLIDTLVANYNIDNHQVFSTGISNGAFMSIYLAYKLSSKIAGIAPVCGNIPANLKDNFSFPDPVSMLLINGTDDPLVKYDGGWVGFRQGTLKEGKRGRSVSTDETIKIWNKILGCDNTPSVEKMPDKDTDDDCTAEKFVYKNCQESSQLELIKITGGGHTWPGEKQYLPKKVVGPVCRDFNASEEIWGFFKSLNR